MRCRNFDRDCADWLRGRLSQTDAQAMAAHESQCAHCARIASEERRILAIAARQVSPAPAADLWPRLEQRLHELGSNADAAAARPLVYRPRPFAGVFAPIRWAILGAAVALLAFLIGRPAPQQTALVRPEDERRLVEMIAASQPVRYIEVASDDTIVGSEFDTQRVLLVGDGE
ncbi:MAG: anti-sigma factor [Chthonomonadales bacterium]|nr:anti-sigma factor [Chthonomonadales bacterium]